MLQNTIGPFPPVLPAQVLTAQVIFLCFHIHYDTDSCRQMTSQINAFIYLFWRAVTVAESWNFKACCFRSYQKASFPHFYVNLPILLVYVGQGHMEEKEKFAVLC